MDNSQAFDTQTEGGTVGHTARDNLPRFRRRQLRFGRAIIRICVCLCLGIRRAAGIGLRLSGQRLRYEAALTVDTERYFLGAMEPEELYFARDNEDDAVSPLSGYNEVLVRQEYLLLHDADDVRDNGCLEPVKDRHALNRVAMHEEHNFRRETVRELVEDVLLVHRHEVQVHVEKVASTQVTKAMWQVPLMHVLVQLVHLFLELECRPVHLHGHSREVADNEREDQAAHEHAEDSVQISLLRLEDNVSVADRGHGCEGPV